MSDHKFPVVVAKDYDVETALLLEFMRFITIYNKSNGRHIHDDSVWVYNSYEAWTKQFPYWTSKQMRRILGNAENFGLIKVSNYNKRSGDLTKWYALTDKAIEYFPDLKELLLNTPAQTGKPPAQTGKPPAQMGSALPDTNTDTNTDKKRSKTLGDSSNAPSVKSVDNYKGNPLFSKFYLNYPNKQKPKEAYKEFKKLEQTEEFVSMLLDDINKRRAKDKRWKTRQYIPHPANYLRSEYWMGDLVTEDAPKQKYPTKEERAENEKQIKKREEEAARLKREEIEASKNFKDTLFQ